MDLLKLIALDGDDIEVVSAHLQDAVLISRQTSAGVQANTAWWSPSTASIGKRASGQSPKFQRPPFGAALRAGEIL